MNTEEMHPQKNEKNCEGSLREYLGDAVVNTNQYGQVLYWNKGAERIFGYKKEEVMGQNFFDLVVPFGEIDNFIKAAEIAKRQGYLNNCTLPKLRKDGTAFISSTNVTIFKDENGRHSGTCSIIRDLSNDDKIDEKLLQAEKMAIVGNLAGKVAHEINNPLNNILWSAESIKKKINKNKEMEGSLDDIILDVEYASKITRDLLNYARKNDPVFKEIDVGFIIEKALNMLSFNLKDISIIKKYDEVPTVSGDSNQILQVLLNIFTNAIQATPKGGSITIELGNKENYLQIKVSDSGEGISKDQIGMIFEPFFTTKKEGMGTGLGLSISKEIMEKHRGFIDVVSDIDLGSTFTIGFPMEDC